MDLVLGTVYDTLYSVVSVAAIAAAAEQDPTVTLTTSRRLRHWSNVSPSEMPIMMMSQKTIDAQVRPRGAPSLWTLHADFMIYVHNSDQYSSPSTLLLPLVDAVRAALEPLPPPPAGNGMCHLGIPAMVEHAAIEGEIETDEGLLGDLAIAMIPVKILCKPSY